MIQMRDQRQLHILFPHTSLSSFIQTDIDILRSRHAVRLKSCWSIPQIIASLPAVFWSDCVFCWFGSLRFLPIVLLARLLGKKIIIVAGGYDVAKVPEIKYGNMYGTVHKYLGRALFKMAHLVACVSNSNARESVTNAKVAADKTVLLYHGFSESFVTVDAAIDKKEKFVLTVGTADLCTIYRKGLLAIAKASRLLPDISFVIAGPFQETAMDILKKAAGQNVRFVGYLKKEELHELFARAKVYIQPSVHEAFGCSVAEAMLYDCIPIVSNRFALPEVVGDSGFVVDPDDYDDMALTLKRALEMDVRVLPSPKQRILREFPLSRRSKSLLEAVDRCVGS
jgi:glycosyltransferase involved in cell wall biosynthesis